MLKLDRPIKAITFDVGYTLLYPIADVGEMYRVVFRRYGIDASAALLRSEFFCHWRSSVASQRGLIYGTTHEEALVFWGEIIRKMLDTIFPNGVFPVDQLALALYEEFSEAKAWRLVSSWGCVLKQCRALGLKVGLLSNWDLRLGALLAELGLTDQVDFQVISAEHGLEKPSVAIFECAAMKAGVDVSELLHVGDTWVDDVVGATGAGCQAIWLADEGDMSIFRERANVRVINVLSELTALCF